MNNKKILYPIIALVILGGGVAAYINRDRFLSKKATDSPAVTQTKTQNDTTSEQTVDTQNSGLQVSDTPLNPTMTNPNSATDTPQSHEDKSAIRISILNSTTTSGIAGTLKEALEAAGFSNITTGNTTPPASETSVNFSTNAGTTYPESLSELINLVTKSYPNTVSAEKNELNDTVDLTIILGKK